MAEPRWCPGKHYLIRPGMPSSKKLQKILHDVLSSVSESLKAPVCITDVELNLRSQFLRTDEVCRFPWPAWITYILFCADGCRELVRGCLEACL